VHVHAPLDFSPYQVPNLIWRDVILELDYPGFFLPSPEALGLIMSVYRVASRDPFPMESLYLGWECPKGQVGREREHE